MFSEQLIGKKKDTNQYFVKEVIYMLKGIFFCSFVRFLSKASVRVRLVTKFPNIYIKNENLVAVILSLKG